MKQSHASYAILTKTFLLGGLTLQEIVEQTGQHAVTVRGYAKALRNLRLLYIECWAPNSIGQYVLPVYKVGTGKDAQKPKPVSAAERQARYRKKKQARASVFDWHSAKHDSHSLPLSGLRMLHDSVKQGNV